jgi:hypothetical protein
MDVNRISFDEIKSYWIEVDHFGNPNKKIREVVRRLGAHESTVEEPRRFSYGLFDSGRLIGVTHLVEWSNDWLRYRTINVRKSYRGRDLGWFLLCAALDMDWRDWKKPDKHLFGWVKRDHLAWSEAHGFKPADDRWHDDHIAVIKPLSDF